MSPVFGTIKELVMPSEAVHLKYSIRALRRQRVVVRCFKIPKLGFVAHSAYSLLTFASEWETFVLTASERIR